MQSLQTLFCEMFLENDDHKRIQSSKGKKEQTWKIMKRNRPERTQEKTRMGFIEKEDFSELKDG